MISSSGNKSINFRSTASFSLQGTCKPSPLPRLHLIAQMLLFLPSNKDHLSGKKNNVFLNLPVAPFFKCPTTFPDSRIQTAYLSTGLFGSICASRLPPISGVHMSLYAWWPLTDVSIWLSRWWRKNVKKVLEIEKLCEMSLMK